MKNDVGLEGLKGLKGSTARIYEILTRLSRLLQAEERASGELLPVQLQALLYLSRSNRYSDTPSAVAEYLGITKGTASQTLGALERGGLIAKATDSNDRRSVRLRLTAKGKRLIDERTVPHVLEEGLSPLTESNRAQIQSELEELLRSIQRAAGGRSFGVCHTCRHFRKISDTEFQCGLTDEPLASRERLQLCREHESTPVARGSKA